LEDLEWREILDEFLKAWVIDEVKRGNMGISSILDLGS
jgi:hypothetical protein